MPDEPKWKLKDYVDERGRNRIQDWLLGHADGDRAKINARLRHLTRYEKLEFPLYRRFKKPWRKLGEVRIKTRDFEIRILCCMGPGSGVVTMLLGTHKKKGDVSDGEKATAARRMELAKASPKARTIEHDLEG